MKKARTVATLAAAVIGTAAAENRSEIHPSVDAVVIAWEFVRRGAVDLK